MDFFGWTNINGLIEPKGWIFFRGKKKHGAKMIFLDLVPRAWKNHGKMMQEVFVVSSSWLGQCIFDTCSFKYSVNNEAFLP